MGIVAAEEVPVVTTCGEGGATCGEAGAACCSAGALADTGSLAASNFGVADPELWAQAMANREAAASAPPPAKAIVLTRFRECVLDCSIALATEALSDTDAGYDGPLNLDRTLVSSFAISSAVAYRSDGSLAIALSTIRFKAGGSPGISSVIVRGVSVMILKNRFWRVGPSKGFVSVRT
jgi:hypothetical protein